MYRINIQKQKGSYLIKSLRHIGGMEKNLILGAEASGKDEPALLTESTDPYLYAFMRCVVTI